MGLTEATIIAEVTKDYLLADDEEDACLYRYQYVGFRRYWTASNWPDHYENFPTLGDLIELPKTRFRAYDDDDVLYYAGWLYNDPEELMVQQYILDDLQRDSGIVYLKIQNLKTGEWKVEI